MQSYIIFLLVSSIISIFGSAITYTNQKEMKSIKLLLVAAIALCIAACGEKKNAETEKSAEKVHIFSIIFL